MGVSGGKSGTGDGAITSGMVDGGLVPLVSATTHFSDLLRRLANNSAPKCTNFNSTT